MRPVFQKKPAVEIEIGGPSKSNPGDAGLDLPTDLGAMMDGAAHDDGTVTCPNCQCEFDPATGEITGGYQPAPTPPSGEAAQ